MASSGTLPRSPDHSTCPGGVDLPSSDDARPPADAPDVADEVALADPSSGLFASDFGMDRVSPCTFENPDQVATLANRLIDGVLRADCSTEFACYHIERLIERLPAVTLITLGKTTTSSVTRAIDVVFGRLIPAIEKHNFNAIVRLLEIMYLKYERVFAMIISQYYRAVNFFPRGGYVDGERNTPLHHFSTGKVLGKGSYGQVYFGYDARTKAKMAIKRISLPPEGPHQGDPRYDPKRRLEQEIDTMQALSHPNIVQLYGVKMRDSSYYFMMEYCGGGNLQEYIQDNGKLSLEQTLHYTRQLAKGLRVLWHLRILHRDLKPENLLLSSCGTKLKIADFGFARFARTNEEAFYTLVGTFYFIAPEIAEKCVYGRNSDLWSVGCILYQMITGNMRFNGKTKREVMAQWREPHVYQEDCEVDDALKDLISSLLVVDETERIGWEAFFSHRCVNLSTSGEAERIEEGITSSFHSLSCSSTIFDESLKTEKDDDSHGTAMGEKEQSVGDTSLTTMEESPSSSSTTISKEGECVEDDGVDGDLERITKALCRLMERRNACGEERVADLRSREALARDRFDDLSSQVSSLRRTIDEWGIDVHLVDKEARPTEVVDSNSTSFDDEEISRLCLSKRDLQSELENLVDSVKNGVEQSVVGLSSSEMRKIQAEEEAKWEEKVLEMDGAYTKEIDELHGRQEMLYEKQEFLLLDLKDRDEEIQRLETFISVVSVAMEE